MNSFRQNFRDKQDDTQKNLLALWRKIRLTDFSFIQVKQILNLLQFYEIQNP